MKILERNWRGIIASIFHWPVAAVLVAIGILLVGLIWQNFFNLAVGAFVGDLSSHEIVERIFFIFLEIEIAAAIKIYFQANFHFPLRFFLYVGVTDLVRNLIIRQDDAKAALWLSLAVVLIIVALTLWEMKDRKKQNQENEIDL